MPIALLLLALVLAGCAREPLHGIRDGRVQFGDAPAWAAPAYDDRQWRERF